MEFSLFGVFPELAHITPKLTPDNTECVVLNLVSGSLPAIAMPLRHPNPRCILVLRSSLERDFEPPGYRLRLVWLLAILI